MVADNIIETDLYILEYTDKEKVKSCDNLKKVIAEKVGLVNGEVNSLLVLKKKGKETDEYEFYLKANNNEIILVDDNFSRPNKEPLSVKEFESRSKKLDSSFAKNYDFIYIGITATEKKTEAVSKRLKKFERLEKEIENSRDVWKKAKYMNALAVLYELEISDISEEINAPENQDKGKEKALASIAGVMIIEKIKELQQEMDKLAEIMTSDLERRLPELNLSENLEKLAERELEKLRELKEKEKKEKNFQ